jgi:glycosyltransferase involved in cell wall biosynthesis
MQILMIVRQFFPWLGGTEKQAQKLASELINMGIDVKVVTGWWMRTTKRREIVDNIPVFRNFTFWNMLDLKGFRKFSGYIYIISLFFYLWKNRHHYDLIHIHKLSYHAFPGILAGKFFKKKILIKIANSGSYSDIKQMQKNVLIPGQKLMLPLTINADQIVAVNKKIIKELIDAGVPPKKVIFIPNGVKISQLEENKNNYSNGKTIVTFIGRLHPQKSVHILLKAFKKVYEMRPHLNLKLWIIGDGPQRYELEHLSKQQQINKHVVFYGNVQNISEKLNLTDIFVLPSLAEGMSNSLLEAMAHGLPCIATRIGGNQELITNGINGILVPAKNVNALYDAILKLVDDKKLRQMMGKISLERVKGNYCIKDIAKRYIEEYEYLLKSSKNY